MSRTYSRPCPPSPATPHLLPPSPALPPLTLPQVAGEWEVWEAALCWVVADMPARKVHVPDFLEVAIRLDQLQVAGRGGAGRAEWVGDGGRRREGWEEVGEGEGEGWESEGRGYDGDGWRGEGGVGGGGHGGERGVAEATACSSFAPIYSLLYTLALWYSHILHVLHGSIHQAAPRVSNRVNNVTWVPCSNVTWVPCSNVTWAPCSNVTWAPCSNVTWAPCSNVTWAPCSNVTWVPCSKDQLLVMQLNNNT